VSTRSDEHERRANFTLIAKISPAEGCRSQPAGSECCGTTMIRSMRAIIEPFPGLG
jgi:hypothetical protein